MVVLQFSFVLSDFIRVINATAKGRGLAVWELGRRFYSSLWTGFQFGMLFIIDLIVVVMGGPGSA